MENMIKEVIVVGGGASIAPQIEVLRPILASKCTILINYAYKHFDGTFLTYIDKDFYVPLWAKENRNKNNVDIYKELESLPLIIGFQEHHGYDDFLHPNTYLIDNPKKEMGRFPLTGFFALAIAEKLEPNNIFLLGFDWPRQPVPKNVRDYNPNSGGDIHYYKDIPHRGISFTGFYDNNNPDSYFKFFKDCKSNIYNVSLESNIQNFKKIGYSDFYTLLSNENYNQEELRTYIKSKLNI